MVPIAALLVGAAIAASALLAMTRPRQAAERAGIRGKRLSPHTLRHAAAEDFLRNGGDAFTLQKLLGHTTLAVTRMYVDLVAKDVAEAHKRASPGDNLRLRLR